MFTDIDECTESPCEHHCINALGSFYCDCNEGSTLNDNGLTLQAD